MSCDKLDDHSRTIIHIDIDCFYAQVEMNKNPLLRTKPLGIQQKNCIVTSNYKAREYGLAKCASISEARKLCPDLVLVNGEDLHDYRKVSYRVTELMHKFTNLVERLGLDENFMDVTELVKEKLKTCPDLKLVGNVFGDSEKCECGCTERLTLGTLIAQEMRDLIKNELNLTTCAGIAHNKLLAKIVGSRHKPDQQTVVFPNSGLELILSLNVLTDIPGIGRVMGEQLKAIGVNTVEELQNVEMKKLVSLFGIEKAKTVYNFSYGIDTSAVKKSGKPQSIGLEDSCKSIIAEKEVKNKLEQLLKRLLVLVVEDGRVPMTIKLTVRIEESPSRTAHRETRQCNISPLIFTTQSDKEPKIMATVMHLFTKIISKSQRYRITLLGLSFTKFREPPNRRNSIASFLRKDLEVQSITSIENSLSEEDTNNPKPSTSGAVFKDTHSPTPSPKKLKLANLVTKKRCFDDCSDCESPSKLKVADLSLDSVSCPPDVDKEVFKELPREVRKELWEDYKRRSTERNYCSSQVKKAKPNTLHNYFIKNN